jgi:hypothetical protein
LEILQETKPNDVFIVSVSDESEEAISAYLQKNPIRLAVLKDYLPNSMIKLFEVQSRPYAILLTMDGNILYQGHPSGITGKMIEKYALQIKSSAKIEWKDLFFTVQNTDTQRNSPPQNTEVHIVKQPQAEKRMYVDKGIFYYSGPLSDLFKYLMDCSSYQIVFDGMADYGVSMSCSEQELSTSKSTVWRQIEKRLSLSLQIRNKEMEAYLLEVVEPKRLWDDKQINWGKDINPPYIVGTDRVEADNITLKEVANLLSDIKGNLYYYKGNDENRYDWSFHYRYDNLMTENMESTFGITFKKGKTMVPVYILSAK